MAISSILLALWVLSASIFIRQWASVQVSSWFLIVLGIAYVIVLLLECFGVIGGITTRRDR